MLKSIRIDQEGAIFISGESTGYVVDQYISACRTEVFKPHQGDNRLALPCKYYDLKTAFGRGDAPGYIQFFEDFAGATGHA